MLSGTALRGVRVLELAGLAPAPHCGQILSDFGARVVRIDKRAPHTDTGYEHHLGGLNADCMTRGKLSISVNLKSAAGQKLVQRLANESDVLLEPFRPGVMEKLNLGPQHLLASNPRLIYARLSGYGQTGPMASRAGHDINYLAVSGVLSMLGRADAKPTPPVNLVGDFAGGGLMCAFTILAALLERAATGLGRVIDVSIAEGAAYVGTFLWQSRRMPIWFSEERGGSALDSGAHFYDTYETADGRHMAVGAIEPQFYAALMRGACRRGFDGSFDVFKTCNKKDLAAFMAQILLTGLGLKGDEIPPQFDVENWPNAKRQLAAIFRRRTQREWCQVFDDVDACVTPVVHWRDAPDYPHNKERSNFVDDDNTQIKAPRPNLYGPEMPSTPEPVSLVVGQHTRLVLRESGFSDTEIEKLIDSGDVFQSIANSKL